MIRKIFSVLFGLLILAVAARAETGEEIALAAYPGYVVASSDSGNGFGVFALENGGSVIYAEAERTEYLWPAIGGGAAVIAAAGAYLLFRRKKKRAAPAESGEQAE